MYTMMLAFLLCPRAVGIDEWSTQPPPALLAVEQARSVRKAHVEWTRRNYEKANVAHYTSRFANEDQIVVNRGDDEGVVFRDHSGNPVREFKGSAYHVLLRDGLRWNSDGRCGVAYVDKTTAEHQLSGDIRAVGLGPSHYMQQDVHSTLWRFGLEKHGEISYKSAQENGLHVARARVRTAHGSLREVVWWIDARKDWCPVRVAYLVDGEVRMETRITAARFGDKWFPDSVARFRWQYKDGEEPYEIVTVHTATFDEALPDRFTPEDIGVEVGTNVISSLTPRLDPERRTVGWDGTKLVPYGELIRRLRSGELEYGAGFRRINKIWRIEAEAAARAGDPEFPKVPNLEGPDRLGIANVDRTPGLWELYVERFIAKYKLNRDQAQKTRTVLRYCQEQGHNYLNRRADELRKLEEAEKKVKEQAADVEESAAAAALADILRQKKRLERPLVRIFEDQLVPRLERLPTRQQRKAAQESGSRKEGHSKP